MINRRLQVCFTLVLMLRTGAVAAQDASTTVYDHLTQDFDVLDPHLTNTTLGY